METFLNSEVGKQLVTGVAIALVIVAIGVAQWLANRSSRSERLNDYDNEDR